MSEKDVLNRGPTRHDREYFSYDRKNDLITKRVSIEQESGDAIFVAESPAQVAVTKLITVTTTEQVIFTGVANMTNRDSILIQPINGAIKFGSTSGEVVHELSKKNFHEATYDEVTDLYVKAKKDTVKVAVTEYRRVT